MFARIESSSKHKERILDESEQMHMKIVDCKNEMFGSKIKELVQSKLKRDTQLQIFVLEVLSRCIWRI